MSNSNQINFDKYLQLLKSRGYDNLKSSKHSDDDPLLMDKLAAEGAKLLVTDGKSATKPLPKIDESKSLDIKLAAKSKNPYARARAKILIDTPINRRERILAAEENHDNDNKDYKEFIASVVKLGDKYSNGELDKS